MNESARVRSALRFGIATAIAFGVVSFIAILWLRKTFVPERHPVWEGITAAGGGLLGGSLSAYVGLLVGKLRYKRLGARR